MALTAKQKRNLRKWVEALESGEYEQAHLVLHDPGTGGFCCLGVWCEVGVAGRWEGDSYVPRRNGVWPLCEDIEAIKDDLGLTEDQEGQYIIMNDSARSPFRTIAARIRKDHPEAFA